MERQRRDKNVRRRAKSRKKASRKTGSPRVFHRFSRSFAAASSSFSRFHTNQPRLFRVAMFSSSLALALVLAAALPSAQALASVRAMSINIVADMNFTRTLPNLGKPEGPMKAQDAADGQATLSYFVRNPYCDGAPDASQVAPEGVCLQSVDDQGNPRGSVKVVCSSPTGSWTYEEWSSSNACLGASDLKFSGKHLECDTQAMSIPGYGTRNVGMSVDCGGGEDSAAGRPFSSLATLLGSMLFVVGITM
jgi:hypothetical protein